jgi:DNA-binding NtrC family response regulator
MTVPTLLCVDDDPFWGKEFKILLAPLGYKVVVAESGFEAINFLSLCLDSIAAVVVDYEMAAFSGNEVAANIKLFRPELPVVIMSGCCSMVQDASHFLDAGVLTEPLAAELIDYLLAQHLTTATYDRNRGTRLAVG